MWPRKLFKRTPPFCSMLWMRYIQITTGNYTCSNGGSSIFKSCRGAFCKRQDDELCSSHDELVGHFRRYSKRDLMHKVTQAGFKLVEARYLLPVSFFALCALRLWKKLRKHKTDDFFDVSPFFNSLLSTYLFAESTLSRFLPFPWGMIVYVVARKT